MSAARGSVADVLAGRAAWAFECRDGFALARELGEGAVDHVIGDPPYDAKTHAKARTLKDGRSDIAIDFAPLPPVESFAPDLVRVAKRWVICFCAVEQIGDYKSGIGVPEHWIRGGIWVRTNGTPQISGDRPAQGAEGIAIMHGEVAKKRWNRGGNRGVWTGPICKDKRRIHPTKKPLWLMEALLRDFTDPGDLVFDPTAGEGTTGEACVRLGRRFIGCELKAACASCGSTTIVPCGCHEKSVNYFAAGERRIERAAAGLKQTELFS